MALSMAMAATTTTVDFLFQIQIQTPRARHYCFSFTHSSSSSPSICFSNSCLRRKRPFPSLSSLILRPRLGFVLACASSSATPSTSSSSTRLYISGLSFRTTEESLRNAFKDFGQLVEVNLVMDRIANRPRGFAFLQYATEEESQKAIAGMHGKFLDGRVIFVEVAKPRSAPKQNPS